ncbi:hypothetical protein [Gluconobacter sp.]
MKELAYASGLSVNNIRMIMDREPGLLTDEYVPVGRGVSRTFPIKSLKRAALMHAVTKMGVGITQAARMVAEFSSEFEMNHDGLPANIDAIIPRKYWSDLVKSVPKDEMRHGNNYEYYFYIIHVNETNQPVERKIYVGDMIMEIIDQTYVFQTMIRGEISPGMLEGPSSEAIMAMEGWERGGDFSIKSIMDFGDTPDTWKREAKKWQKVRENCTTKTQINVSLAIRDAFERVRLLRAEG